MHPAFGLFGSAHSIGWVDVGALASPSINLSEVIDAFVAYGGHVFHCKVSSEYGA